MNQTRPILDRKGVAELIAEEMMPNTSFMDQLGQGLAEGVYDFPQDLANFPGFIVNKVLSPAAAGLMDTLTLGAWQPPGGDVVPPVELYTPYREKFSVPEPETVPQSIARLGGNIGSPDPSDLLKILGMMGAGTLTAKLSKSVPKLEDVGIRAKRFFGTTSVPEETGYLMPDGTRLNFSEGKLRADHGDVRKIYTPEEVAEVEKTAWGYSDDFQEKTGAVRYRPEAGVSFTTKPTDEQIRIFTTDFAKRRMPLTVEWLTKNGEVIASKTFDRPIVDAVSAWIEQNKNNKPVKWVNR